MSAKPKPASPEPATTAISVPVPTLGEDTREAMTATTYAQSFTVASASDSAKGQEARARLNTKIKDLTERRLKITRIIDASKKEVMELFAGPITQFTLARDAIDQKVIAWDAQQEELRKAEQRRLDKIAEDERRELQRKADETARKAREEADKKRREAEAAAAAGRQAEADRLRAAAARVEEKAADKADAYQDRAAAVVAPVVQAETARVAGTSMRDNWKWRVKDKTKINDAFMMKVTNDAAIDGVVKSMKDEATSVVGEGIEVYNDRGLASRRT